MDKTNDNAVSNENVTAQLDENENKATINISPVAEDDTSEDTTGDNYRALVEKQNNLIDTLMGQIDSYQKQIETLMRNGAVIRDNASDAAPEHDSVVDSPDYVSLADLGKEIGKR